MRRFAVSTWSLDGLIQSGVTLLEIPRQLQQHGIAALEICHFHLPTTHNDYVQALRTELQVNNIELFSVLVDAGDITAAAPPKRTADIAFTYEWIAHAAALGATRVRIGAGRQPPTPEVISQSTQQLRAFADHASMLGLSVSTENWLTTAQDPSALREILERCEGRVGLCVDTGNAEATRDKYETIAQLLPYANSIHFKARYTAAGEIDRVDLERCIALIRQAATGEVISLIFDRKQDEWAGISHLRDALVSLL